MFSKTRSRVLLTLAALYGAELLDELIYGLNGAVLPRLKNDLGLSYTQIGLLFTIPGLVALAADPLVGLLADTRHRRSLVIGGIIATALGLLLVAISNSYGPLLLAFTILFAASGAYVNLSEATLVDRNPARAEQTMARWTLLGSIGVSAAPVIVTITLGLGYGWRGLYLGGAMLAGLFTFLLASQRFDLHAGASEETVSPRELVHNLFAALRKSEVMRWVILTEFADLMLDKLLEVVGLYFHDVVGVSFAEASAAVAIFSGAGLVGNVLLLPALERFSGTRLVRVTALIAFVLYVAFLLVPLPWLKFILIGAIALATSGWFAILRGKTFSELPGQSGMILAIGAFANISNLLVPVIIGRIADTFGLNSAMWLLAIGPLVLFFGLGANENPAPNAVQ